MSPSGPRARPPIAERRAGARHGVFVDRAARRDPADDVRSRRRRGGRRRTRDRLCRTDRERFDFGPLAQVDERRRPAEPAWRPPPCGRTAAQSAARIAGRSGRDDASWPDHPPRAAASVKSAQIRRASSTSRVHLLDQRVDAFVGDLVAQLLDEGDAQVSGRRGRRRSRSGRSRSARRGRSRRSAGCRR